MTFTLPELPYAYDALGPPSKETLEFHHDKHHKAYVTRATTARGHGSPGQARRGDRQGELQHQSGALQQRRPALQPHPFLEVDEAERRRRNSRRAREAIDEDLGWVEKFKADFIQAGIGQFGSGWAWLAVKDGKLAVLKTPNGENPLVHGAKPILGVDVWEHSYYIDYRNRRPDYLKAFIENLVNWEHVEAMYAEASK